jgi:ATP-dependent RNA helicase SUPV3L1/SUV3
VRSWSYICQRPDWVLAREEMAERARAVEARLSDALHARLTERFVNRRTAVLMRRVGHDAALLPVRVEGDAVLVEEEKIGELAGFAFRVDPAARADDVRLLTAAAEKHLPRLLAARAGDLAAAVHAGEAELALEGGAVLWRGAAVARLRSRGRLPSCWPCRNWWPPPRWTGWTTPRAPNCWPRWNNGWPRAGSRWRRWRGWRRPALILPAGRNCALLIRLLEGGHGRTRRIGAGTAGARAARGLAQAGREGGRAGSVSPAMLKAKALACGSRRQAQKARWPIRWRR